MVRLRHSLAALALVAALAAASCSNGGSNEGRFTVALSGAAEAPGPGAAGGAGSVTLTLNGDQRKVCYELTTSGVGQLTGIHVHRAESGKSGQIVVNFGTPAASGCAENVDADLVKRIIDKPAEYYFNAHTAEFPDGAVRGQLK
jgi:hypothetical protein